MSAINPTSSVVQSAENISSGGQNDGFSDLNIDEFLQLLITEMQNQDPLDPMQNSEMLQQIGQIREIGATDQLTSTLGNLASSQELVAASGLIGKEVQALADDSTEISGVVDRVTVQTNEDDSRNVKVHVGGKTMNIKNIREIQTG